MRIMTVLRTLLGHMPFASRRLSKRGVSGRRNLWGRTFWGRSGANCPEVICLPNETRREDAADGAAAKMAAETFLGQGAFANKRVEDAVFEEISELQEIELQEIEPREVEPQETALHEPGLKADTLTIDVFKKAPENAPDTPAPLGLGAAAPFSNGEKLRFDRPIFLTDRAPEPLLNQPERESQTRPATRPSRTNSHTVSSQAAQTATKPAAKTASWSPSARVLALLAVIAVPAVAAATQNLGQLPGDAPTEAQMVSAQLREQLARNPAMPFEKPGMSFPGSAFYFLADPPKDALIALPTTDALLPETGEAGHTLGQAIDAGPGANPFYSHGGTSHLRASNCLAQAIWYEAASENEAGKRAVAQVVLNRVAHSSWPNSVCGVVYQGSNRRTGCQFSFTCDGSLARKTKGRSWNEAQKLAGEALGGSVYRPIGHATHYHTLWVNPYWASSLDHVGTIGAHRFYRNRGASGKQSAFTQSYAGAEPIAASVSATGAQGRLTPAQVTPVSAAGIGAQAETQNAAAFSGTAINPSNGAQGYQAPAPAAPIAGPGAVRADTANSGVGQVRQDYSRAGQWKSDAARAALQAQGRERANTPPPGSSKPG